MPTSGKQSISAYHEISFTDEIWRLRIETESVHDIGKYPWPKSDGGRLTSPSMKVLDQA